MGSLAWPWALHCLLLLLQAEVEQFYINKGYLIPTFHKSYWLSLQSSTTTYPKFVWTDPTVRTGYLNGGPHWGTYTIAGSAAEPKKEPNAIQPPEYCAVANYTQRYGQPSAWGWSDVNCNRNFIFICRLQSGWHGMQRMHCILSTACMQCATCAT